MRADNTPGLRSAYDKIRIRRSIEYPVCGVAVALRRDSALSIRGWAEEMSLAASTVSRGFRAAYGCTAAAYRAEIRARNAWRGIVSTSTSLGFVAAEHGFSDQAHMTRTIRELTGAPPRSWRLHQPYLS